MIPQRNISLLSNRTSKGLAGRLGIGKDLWVTSNMALGLCGQLWFGAGRDWSAPAVGLAVSFAYN